MNVLETHVNMELFARMNRAVLVASVLEAHLVTLTVLAVEKQNYPSVVLRRNLVLWVNNVLQMTSMAKMSASACKDSLGIVTQENVEI